jgi:hypothetical protein
LQKFSALYLFIYQLKVETIGDAYMLVSGVPIKTPCHAQPIADFAMDIVVEAAKVKSPITGKPIEVNRYNC